MACLPYLFRPLETLTPVTGLRDAYGESGDQRRDRGEKQLSVSQHAEARSGDLAGGLRHRDRGEERDEEEIREEAPPCEEERNEREHDAELRARTTRPPRDHEARQRAESLEREVRVRREQWKSAVGPEEDEARAAREHR